jgi:hypothetical protein
MAKAEAPKAKRKAKPAPAPEALPMIQSIKGFDQNWTCRGFQFAPGQTYTHKGSVKACAGGFHACTIDAHPFEVFGYYAPAGSRFALVEQGGATNSDNGIKIASATITIGVELSIGDLVKRAWDYVWSRATKSDEAHVTVDQGAASSTGDQGAASSTGDRGAASSTGDRGAASSTGTRGAAMASGYAGKVMGTDTNALFAVERDDNFNIVSVAAGIVGRDGIEANVWYVARGGKLVLA